MRSLSWRRERRPRHIAGRVRQVANRLLCDLMIAIDELDIGMDEFWAGIGYIGRAAKDNELGLVVPSVGGRIGIDNRR